MSRDGKRTERPFDSAVPYPLIRDLVGALFAGHPRCRRHRPLGRREEQVAQPQEVIADGIVAVGVSRIVQDE